MRITKFMKEMSMFSSFYDRNRNIYSGRGTNFLTSVERKRIEKRIKRKSCNYRYGYILRMHA